MDANRFAECVNLLFFSRGRGHGHAIPDMAIADELEKLRNNVDLRFVSYGTGAKTFASHNRPVIDLEMPDKNPVWTTAVRAGALIRETQPDLVISHEEFAALPAAKIFGIPAVFITEWFSDPETLPMQALECADEVLFIEDEAIFPEPPCVEGRVHYVGPVLRHFNYGPLDRERARRELGIDSHAAVILVIPGGWATEEREPIYNLVLPAFDALRAPAKLLLWMAGEDEKEMRERIGPRSDIVVKGFEREIDRIMAASDLAITKANRITLKELGALGIPSISISHGRNPIDDVLIERIPTNIALDARTVSAKVLAKTIVEMLKDSPRETTEMPPHENSGAARAAEALSAMIDRLALKDSADREPNGVERSRCSEKREKSIRPTLSFEPASNFAERAPKHLPKIAVAINVHKEPREQVAECTQRIVSNLPSATVMLFIDGESRPDILDLAKQFGFSVIEGENLGRNATWHRWWQRMLNFFDSTDAEACFKFDPDTMVDATPENISPEHYFGSVTHVNAWKTPFVQGGITGLSRELVQLLLSNRSLEPGRHKRWMMPVPPDLPFRDDQMIAEAIAALGVRAVNWPECKSQWKTPLLNDPIQYAIVHPRYYPHRAVRMAEPEMAAIEAGH